MMMNLLPNIAAAWRRIALLAAAVVIIGAPVPIWAHVHSGPGQQAQQTDKDRKQQQKTEKEQQKTIKKVVKKAHRRRGDAREIMQYERAHFHAYDPHAGEHIVPTPDQQFQAHFGRQHRFHMARPTVVEGFPRFEYHGFSFVVEQPWPEYWYDDDDYYIVFERGAYYLRDYDDPGVEVQVVLVRSVF
ncbi:MAG TPA: hypothetical protein VN745_01320 [Verrucomicrobiae bacterium]|nr:hypothetical protein [Verrucomicrobiae bacterium]